MVSRAQLLEAGLTATMVAKRVGRGQLVPLHRGVYAVGHRSLRSEGFWLAAVLAVGPGAVLSHRDAAALHELRPTNGAKIDVSAPAQRRGTAKVRTHGRRTLDARDTMSVAGIPATTVARTLVDLAEVVSAQALAKALSEAERQGKLDAPAVRAALTRTRGRRGPGHAALAAVLAEHAERGSTLTRSELEDRFVALLDAHDLPRPATNAHVAGYEADAVWPGARLVVELDGWAYHRGRRAFQDDRAKGNALVAAGWQLLRFTHADIARRPDQAAAAVAVQLSRAA